MDTVDKPKKGDNCLAKVFTDILGFFLPYAYCRWLHKVSSLLANRTTKPAGNQALCSKNALTEWLHPNRGEPNSRKKLTLVAGEQTFNPSKWN